MKKHVLLAALLALGAASVQAQSIIDAAGDFLPTYTGPQNGDVDVLSAFAGYNASTDRFSFSGTFAGAIGTTAGAFYVWGLDRGVGTERFVTGSPSVGQGVKFDAAVFLRPNGTARVTTFVGTVATAVEVGAGTAMVSGDTISGSISGALLGSTGFAKADYISPTTRAVARESLSLAASCANARTRSCHSLRWAGLEAWETFPPVTPSGGVKGQRSGPRDRAWARPPEDSLEGKLASATPWSLARHGQRSAHRRFASG